MYLKFCYVRNDDDDDDDGDDVLGAVNNELDRIVQYQCHKQ